jgi:hypothetical protein
VSISEYHHRRESYSKFTLKNRRRGLAAATGSGSVHRREAALTLVPRMPEGVLQCPERIVCTVARLLAPCTRQYYTVIKLNSHSMPPGRATAYLDLRHVQAPCGHVSGCCRSVVFTVVCSNRLDINVVSRHICILRGPV